MRAACAIAENRAICRDPPSPYPLPKGEGTISTAVSPRGGQLGRRGRTRYRGGAAPPRKALLMARICPPARIVVLHSELYRFTGGFDGQIIASRLGIGGGQSGEREGSLRRVSWVAFSATSRPFAVADGWFGAGGKQPGDVIHRADSFGASRMTSSSSAIAAAGFCKRISASASDW